MVQIDPTLGAAVGATLAAAARVQLRSEPSLWKNAYLGGAVAFAAFFVAPAVLYTLVGWPSWDTMYWYDRDTLPAVLPAAVTVSVLAGSALGFVAGHALVRAGRERAAIALPGLLCLPSAVVIAVWFDRFLHVGTRASFAAGAPANVLQSDLVGGIAGSIGVYVLVPLTVLALRWARPALREARDRRAAAPAP